MLIGADGLRSTVRQQCLPDGRAALRGLCRLARAHSGERAAACNPSRLFEAMTFCLPPGEQFLGYPVAGPDNDLRPGQRRYNIVWYRPAEEQRASAAAHRRKRRYSCDLDPAAADPRRSHRRHARCGGAAAGAAIARHRALDRRADVAADLRSRQPATCIRPCRHHRRCGLRGASACGGRGVQRRPTMRRRSPRRSTATDIEDALRLSRLRVCRKTIASSSARGISAPISGDPERPGARPFCPPRHSLLAETAVFDFLYA